MSFYQSTDRIQQDFIHQCEEKNNIFAIFLIFTELLSYVNVLTCAVNAQPWDCVYQRSGKMLDSIQDALVRKEAELKGKYHCFYFATQLACEEVNVSPSRDLLSTERKTTAPAHLHIDLHNMCVLISNDITRAITRQLIPMHVHSPIWFWLSQFVPIPIQ